ncbi:aminopeptidase N [Alteromonas sp. ASW11-36]|uniref:Aminopeptidase N n=1 Tax=Alteromonas arenosi TaxID=3055817 RepID=A0ABT7SXI8_9ALTE|nr:aminopeptidase N [Alteromonas sp. ASW11-36]MDM7860880.1 aminopeptidase N [Alteromonas sp. ASW11-36]
MSIKAAKRREDYLPPDFTVDHIDLKIVLAADATSVSAVLQVTRIGSHERPLCLDGEQLTLKSVEVDGIAWTDYQLSETALTINGVPDSFVLSTVVEIAPAHNTSLEGLYLSDGAFCTQCEAEGFRKITYFLDRPDVLSMYDVTITAPQDEYPQLLSNGNKLASGHNDDGTHWVKWQDPHRKPCYLFALVAGDFDLLTDEFTTQSGRVVALELYVDKGKLNRGQHALDSLKRAMRWDEEVFGLEYDLDVYMIVAVDFFNMGAMENKGLNVFNSKFVLADSETATDDDYFNIESVIAHEYFHNWTGNRVTCRDWFQLSLKEGLTVFRDQIFSETFNSPLATRIKQVKVIREHQFAEDAGPMSHPIRPDEVIEMNNFYTVTVYDKGAEVIRMLWTLLTPEGFKRGMRFYFDRHDGQAVTCDDFVNAMQDANDIDLSLFKRWYGQSGTPRISIAQHGDKLTIGQHTPATADQASKQALLIPLQLEMVPSNGQGESVQLTVALKSETQEVLLPVSSGNRVLSVNSGFSAPVIVEQQASLAELGSILSFAKSDFDRWEASQALFKQAMLANMEGDASVINETAQLMAQFITAEQRNLALLSEVLIPPSVESLVAGLEQVNVDALLNSHKAVYKRVAIECAPMLEKLLAALVLRDEYAYTPEQIVQRKALNTLLKLYSQCQDTSDMLTTLFTNADNMTDTLTALQAAQLGNQSTFESLMQQFEERWQDDPLVLDKWFALHATTERPDILARLQLLMEHKQYTLKNPNRIRAILGSFAFYNTAGLHLSDGSGYRFFTDHLLAIDPVNPQVAARIVTPLLSWRKFDSDRQDKIKFHLTRILDNPQISSDLFEKVSKSLAQ